MKSASVLRLIASSLVLLGCTIVPSHAADFMQTAKADFLQGLEHPIGGWDHIAVMAGIGLWAALVLPNQRSLWPLAFTLFMFVAFWARFIGVVVPYVETGILASVVIVGLLIVFCLRLPLIIGAILLGFLAIFHGAAHANEANATTLLIYAAGFSVGCFALGLAGIGLGSLTEWKYGRFMLRGVGVVIAALGLFALYGA